MGWNEDSQKQVIQMFGEGKLEHTIVKEVRQKFRCDDKTVRRCIAGLELILAPGSSEHGDERQTLDNRF